MLVALHRGEGWIARAIKWQTRSVYSHASIVLEDSGMVIEAREFQGVRRVSWKEVVASGERVDLFRVKGLSEEAEEVVLEFLWEQMGKPYDYTMVARFISRRQAAREESGKWFCSELVFAALAKAGVRLLERIEAWEVSPGVLRLSPRLEEVQSPKFKVQDFERSGHGDISGRGVPLTPALSPKGAREMENLSVSMSPGIACESGQVGKGSTESRPTGIESAGEGACPTTQKEAEYVR